MTAVLQVSEFDLQLHNYFKKQNALYILNNDFIEFSIAKLRANYGNSLKFWKKKIALTKHNDLEIQPQKKSENFSNLAIKNNLRSWK